MEQPNRVATVGQLRAVLEGIPDNTPLVVNAAYPGEPESVDEQVITSTGFGLVDWGDGYGLEPDSVFALNCHRPGAELRHKPVRPARQPGATPSPVPECRTCAVDTAPEKVSRHEWFRTDKTASPARQVTAETAPATEQEAGP
jgi:hypothetical protein